MILKVRIHDKHEVGQPNFGWRLWDDLRSVHYEHRYLRYDEQTGELFDRDQKAEEWKVVPDYINIEPPPTTGKIYCILVWALYGGRNQETPHRLFVFNSEAYLLNDEGKTIERLN